MEGNAGPISLVTRIGRTGAVAIEGAGEVAVATTAGAVRPPIQMRLKVRPVRAASRAASVGRVRPNLRAPRAREARVVALENRVAPIVTEGVGADVGVDGVVRAMARAGLQTAAGQTAAAGARATGADRTRVAAPASRSLSRNRRSW